MSKLYCVIKKIIVQISEQRTAFRHRHRFKLFHLVCKQKQSNPLDFLIRVVFIRATQSPLFAETICSSVAPWLSCVQPNLSHFHPSRVSPAHAARSPGKITSPFHTSSGGARAAALAAGVVGLAQLPFSDSDVRREELEDDA